MRKLGEMAGGGNVERFYNNYNYYIYNIYFIYSKKSCFKDSGNADVKSE